MMQVAYFNGKNSKRHAAELYLYDSKWVIAFINAEGVYEEVFWNLLHIKKAEHIGDRTLFKNNNKASIEYSNTQIDQAIEKKYPQQFFNATDTFINKNSKRHYLSYTALLLLFIFVIYQYIMPLGGQLVFSQIPDSYDVDLGDQLYSTLKEEMPEDSIASIYANQFAQTIDFKTHYPIKIHVVDDQVRNAFALPGGNIVVYSQLIKEMKSPEAFAALLSHEVVHVKNRHSMQNISKQLTGYLFLSLLINDANGMQALMLENIHRFKNLDYARSIEKEADIDGLEILLRNNIKQSGFVDLFSALMIEEEEPSFFSELLSTHPALRERMEYCSSIAKKQLPSQIKSNMQRQQAWEKLNSKINNENIEHVY
jgi:predicted Zn-dependent protease